MSAAPLTKPYHRKQARVIFVVTILDNKAKNAKNVEENRTRPVNLTVNGTYNHRLVKCILSTHMSLQLVPCDRGKLCSKTINT